MKKLLISMLVLTTLVTMVGCNDKKTGDTNSKPVENEQVANDSEIKKGRSNDEMYEIYEELLPSMRSYYESLGVDLKEDKSDKAKDYNSATGISYTNYDNLNMDNIDRDKLNNYIGKEKSSLSDIIKHKKCKYSIYMDLDDPINIDIYDVKDSDFLMIAYKDDIIIDIGEQDCTNILSSIQENID